MPLAFSVLETRDVTGPPMPVGQPPISRNPVASNDGFGDVGSRRQYLQKLSLWFELITTFLSPSLVTFFLMFGEENFVPTSDMFLPTFSFRVSKLPGNIIWKLLPYFVEMLQKRWLQYPNSWLTCWCQVEDFHHLLSEKKQTVPFCCLSL